MEYLEDYDFTLHCHPSKANVVADALSRKSRGVLASVASQEWKMLKVVGQLRLHVKPQKYPRIFIIILLYIPGIN